MHLETFISDYIQNELQHSPTTLGVLFFTSISCTRALKHLWQVAQTMMCWFHSSNRELSQTPKTNYFEKSHAVGAVKELCKKITPFSLQLKQGVKQKIYFNTQKKLVGTFIYLSPVASLWVRNDHSAKCIAHQ